MSIKSLLIIFLVIFVIYLYQKNKVIEKLTNINSDELLQKLSSIYNGDTLSVKKLTVTESANIPTLTCKTYTGDNMTVKTCTGDNMTVNNSLTSKNINTFNLYPVSGNEPWIDIHSNCHIYNKLHADWGVVMSGFTVNGNPQGLWGKTSSNEGSYVLYAGNHGLTVDEVNKRGGSMTNKQKENVMSLFRRNGEYHLTCA